MIQDLTIDIWLKTVDEICNKNEPQSERLFAFQKYYVETCEWLNVHHPKIQKTVDNCIKMYIVDQPIHHNTIDDFNGVLQILCRTAELD